MQVSQLKTKHYVIGVAVILLGFSAVTNGRESVQANSQLREEAQARQQLIQNDQVHQSFDLKANQTKAEVAENRYQNGCIFLVNTSSPSDAISLKEGEEVIDMSYFHSTGQRRAFPDGNVVCDAFGNTGEIRDGVVDSLAWTGNKEVVSQAMMAAGFNGQSLGTGNAH